MNDFDPGNEAQGMNVGVLTEELLARAERICRAVRLQGEMTVSGYHERGGASAGDEQGRPAEEKTKWLT